VEQLLNTTNVLEPWYRDQLDFLRTDNAIFYQSFYYLFDAFWASLLATNDLLLTKGANFTGDELLNKLLSLDFQGVSGRVSFDENGDRRMEVFIVQHRYCEDCANTLALEDFVKAGGSLELAELGIFSPATKEVVWMEQVLFYNRTTTPPPNDDLPCLAGWMYDRPLGACTPCPAGWHSREVGSACTECLPGRISSAAEQADCSSCPYGTFSSAFGATVCEICPPGYYAGTIQSQACTKCPAGTYSNSSETRECQACEPGTANRLEGQSQCEVCEVGSAAPHSGMTECVLCPPGRAMDRDYATQCEDCPVGRFSSEFGMSDCAQCLADHDNPLQFITMEWSDAEGQWIRIAGAPSSQSCGCPPGMHNYTADGRCEHCGDEGVDCPGMGFMYLERGFYSPRESPSVYRCYGNFQRCVGGPPGETCAEGRFGLSCARCKAGTTAAADYTCKACTDWDYVPGTVAALAMVGCSVLIYTLQTRAERLSRNQTLMVLSLVLSQLITCLQQLSVLANLSIDWIEPLRSVLDSVKVMSFNVQSLRLNCVGLGTPISSYMFSGMVVLSSIGCFVVVHMLAVLFIHKGNFRDNRAPLIGSLGILLTVFFLPLVETIFGPLQCRNHPNGRWTCRAFPSVACFEGGDHSVLLGLSCMSTILPITFLASCFFIVWHFPSKLRNLDHDFLQTFIFLFFRFRPDKYWFVLLMLLRSLIIGSVPVLPSPILQVMTLTLTVICFSIACAYLSPWRVWHANLSEACLAIIMVVMSTLAAFFVLVSKTDRTQIAWVITYGIIAMLCTMPFILAHSLHRKCFRKVRRYKLALCHCSHENGAFARLLHLCAEQLLCKSGGSSRTGQILLDSDVALDFDGLLDCVANDTKRLVVIAGAEICSTAHCIGQITAARLKSVDIAVLRLPGFLAPTETELLDCLQFLDSSGAALLSSSGIGESLIHGTLQLIERFPHIVVSTEIHNQYLERLTYAIAAPDIKSVTFEPDRQSCTKVCVITDMQHVESASSAFLLVRYIAPAMAMEKLAPHVLPRGSKVGSQVSVAAILFSPGSMEERSFLQTLHGLLGLDACAVPIILDAIFVFPTRSQIENACVAAMGPEDGPPLTELVLSTFKEIACLFHPRSSSVQLLRMHADAIAARLTNPRLHKAKLASADMVPSPTTKSASESRRAGMRQAATMLRGRSVKSSGKDSSSGMIVALPSLHEGSIEVGAMSSRDRVSTVSAISDASIPEDVFPEKTCGPSEAVAHSGDQVEKLNGIPIGVTLNGASGLQAPSLAPDESDSDRDSEEAHGPSTYI